MQNQIVHRGKRVWFLTMVTDFFPDRILLYSYLLPDTVFKENVMSIDFGPNPHTTALAIPIGCNKIL